MKESFFQFSDPRLVNMNFSINENFDNGQFNGFSLNHNVQKVILKENSNAQVLLQLMIGEKTENYPFYLEIELVAEFTCRKENYEGFDDLLNSNAVAVLLSYARPLVSIITSQSGYPALNLPFMNLKEK